MGPSFGAPLLPKERGEVEKESENQVPSRAGNGSLNMSRKKIFFDYLRKRILSRDFEAVELNDLLDLTIGLAPFYCDKNCPIREEIDGCCEVDDCDKLVKDFLQNLVVRFIEKKNNREVVICQ